MTYVERAAEELQFEFDLFDSLFSDDEYYGIASEAEEGGATTPATAPATTSATTTPANQPSASPAPADNKDPNNPGDNKTPENNKGKIGFIRRLEDIVKYLAEMINRAIVNTQAKVAKASTGSKTFTAAMHKWAKSKKPNLTLKITNYVYNDNIMLKITQVLESLDDKVVNKKTEIMNSYVKYSQASMNDEEFDTALTAINNKYPELEDVYTYIGKTVANHKDKVDGAGSLYNILRQKYHSDKDKEVRILTQAELMQCTAFVEDYESGIGKLNKSMEALKKKVDSFKNDVNRIKQFNATQKNMNNLSKSVNEYTTQTTFLVNFCTFAISLLQERYVNCQLVIKRAYGIK